jgi:hypothetical protein
MFKRVSSEPADESSEGSSVQLSVASTRRLSAAVPVGTADGSLPDPTLEQDVEACEAFQPIDYLQAVVRPGLQAPYPGNQIVSVGLIGPDPPASEDLQVLLRAITVFTSGRDHHAHEPA